MNDWKPVNWLEMPANKLMIFYSSATKQATTGYIDIDDIDPRGRLCDEDGGPLRFEDYSHYCYAGMLMPRTSEEPRT